MPLNSEIPQAHDLWITALQAQGRSKSTTDLHRYTTGQLVAWRGNPDLTTVSRFEALSFVKHLNETFKPGGVQSRVKSLRAFFSWAIEEEFIDTNPFAKIKIAVPEDPRPTASDEAIEAMLARAKSNRRDHALLMLLADSGCRKGEIAALTVADINLTAGTVTFTQSKSRPRTVPMTDRCVVTIGRWMRHRGVGPGSLWSVGDPYSLVKAACHRHSKGTLSAHQLRRAFAVRWLLKGGSEVSLMRHAGWSSREMIQLYSRASADTIAAAEFKKLMG